MLAITLDVDWAPDFAIEAAAERLRDAGVRATWFVTHASPAIERLRERPDLFELGIHPNFFAGSSHGDSLDEVLAHMKALVPEARSLRAHGLYQSSRVLAAIARDERLEVDASLFLRGHPHLQPVRQWLLGTSITRIPYFWSEDHEMGRDAPAWSLSPMLGDPGLKVLNFHPIHVYLNSADEAPYRALQASCSALPDADPATAAGLVHRGPGTLTVFAAALERLRHEGGSRTLAQIAGRG